MAITINGSGTITGLSAGGLPDGIVDADMLATSAVTSAKILDGTIASGDIASGVIPAAGVDGITEYDTWQVSSNFTGDATPISTNLARAGGEFEKIGTGMSQSSGVFTFPSTGKWIVRWQFIHGAYVANDYGTFNIKVSVDGGSSWNTRSTQKIGTTTGIRYSSGFAEYLVDVTSTSNVKVRFDVIQANQGNQVYTGSGANYCAMTFVKIGDT